MNTILTKKSIIEWCGRYSFQKGERLSRAGRVHWIRSDANSGDYTAEVTSNGLNIVQVALGWNGQPEAQCTCPALSSGHAFCHHIAAVLVQLYIDQQAADRLEASSARSDLASDKREDERPASPLADRILGLFVDQPTRPLRNQTLTETRSLLQIEFILKLLVLNSRTALFGMEMKLGPQATYVVRDAADFLDQLAQGTSCVISPKFTYDPELHSFAPADENMLRILIDLVQDHSPHRDAATNSAVSQLSPTLNRRMVLLTAKGWSRLMPHLQQASNVTLLDGNTKHRGVLISEEPLPLRFAIDETDSGGYSLHITGIDQLTVMEPYELVYYQGKLTSLPAKQGQRLIEMQQILEEAESDAITISHDQIESFIERVVPGLNQLGSVAIAPSIVKRVTQSPLQARLYLDRVKDRLLAAVEFQYEEIVINPLEANPSTKSAHRIVIRDTESEQRILDLIEQSPFTRTESGYYMSDEEAEFTFLYTILPQLEKLVKVYATNAIKLRVYKLDEAPKVSVHVQADERLNWLEFRLNMDWIPETEIRGLIQALEEKRRYYRLPNGALLPLDSKELQELKAFLADTGFLHTDLTEPTARVPIGRAIHLIDHIERPNPIMKLDRPVRQLLDNLRHPDNLGFQAPEPLTSVLRDYQKTGFQWLKTLAHYGFGGILADDMGLGKTVQSIAYLVSVLPDIRARKQPALVLSPGSLVYNWRDELRKFAPDIRMLIIDGSQKERASKLRRAAEADVILTSYPLLLRDVEAYAKQLFHTIFFDEAQAFKNYTTQTARAVRRLQADHRFALTGTPMENRIEELWSIFHVVFPALFRDLKSFGNFTRSEIGKRARPFMLRRWKRDVLDDLPEKLELIKSVELLPEQKKLYVAYLAKLQQETVKHLATDGYQKSRIKILAGLTRLRQICCHPALFIEGYQGSSAKLKQLLEIVEECMANRKRVLIFSQFTEMLSLIGQSLSDEGIPFFYLDGSTPVRERVELSHRFNNGEMDFFLISLKAGGTGLNLTGADTVILYDLWWNPAVEEQAADRAHRIGQKNVVQVIRMITRDTMEEKMYELQHRKKDLIDEVIGLGEQNAETTLSEQELRELLMI